MPITGTPIGQPVVTDNTCADQTTTIPKVSTPDNVPSPARRQAVEVRQGERKTIQWTLRTPAGDPVDLTSCGFPVSDSSSSESSSATTITGTMTLRILEVMAGSQDTPLELEVLPVDPVNGVVSATLTEAAVCHAGIYLIEWAVFNAGDEMILTNQGHLIVNRGLNTVNRQQGPPSIAEIRLHMRDSGPEDNYLLDSTEFDLAEVAACIERPIQDWNENLPFVPRRYTTKSYPYRSHWLDATVGYLYLLAAQNYRRNRQAHTAAGTAMDDKNKAPDYEALGRKLVSEYKEFVKLRKAQINLEGAYGSV